MFKKRIPDQSMLSESNNRWEKLLHLKWDYFVKLARTFKRSRIFLFKRLFASARWTGLWVKSWARVTAIGVIQLIRDKPWGGEDKCYRKAPKSRNYFLNSPFHYGITWNTLNDHNPAFFIPTISLTLIDLFYGIYFIWPCLSLTLINKPVLMIWTSLTW